MLGLLTQGYETPPLFVSSAESTQCKHLLEFKFCGSTYHPLLKIHTGTSSTIQCNAKINYSSKIPFIPFQGDSGGSLSAIRASGQHEAIGIVSWGHNCADHAAGVYVRVTYYIDLINEEIEEDRKRWALTLTHL